MPQTVTLHAYDLSNGIVQRHSLQCTGRQINGIWHSSIVVFGKEVHYVKFGILTTIPGRTTVRLGKPSQTIDMGTTSLDEETWYEYLADMKEHFTSDKYCFPDFDGNLFTNDSIGFLTGGSIPAFIKDLPSDFFSTSFGATLRPEINSRLLLLKPETSRRSVPQPVASQINPLFQPVASRPGPVRLPSTKLVTGADPIRFCADLSEMYSLLRKYKALVVFFHSASCKPSNDMVPIFKSLAEDKIKENRGGRDNVAFIQVEKQGILIRYNIRVTPTFRFFLDGKQISELKDANSREVRTQTDLLLFQAFPLHPHVLMSFPVIDALPLEPILLQKVPAFDAVLAKFISFIDTAPSRTFPRSEVIECLTQSLFPYLTARFGPRNNDGIKLINTNSSLMESWSQVTAHLARGLPVPKLFPIVDMWRLVVLDPDAGDWLLSHVATREVPDPIYLLIVEGNRAFADAATKSYILTLLHLLSNTFAHNLGQKLLSSISYRKDMTTLLIHSVAHADATVRNAAATLLFNITAYFQRKRIQRIRLGDSGRNPDQDEDGNWEVQMVNAIVGAIDRETSENIVHRLTASLALLVRASPFYENHLISALKALRTKDVLRRKLEKGGCGENGVTQKKVWKLIEELVAVNII